jgi:hypothetical protein
MVDTRHAVGCAALRGGVPCTCWIVPAKVQQHVCTHCGYAMVPPGGRWPSKDAYDDEGGESG